METAEEWAGYLGTTAMMEEQFLQLQDRQVQPDMTSVSARVIDAIDAIDAIDERRVHAMSARCLLGQMKPRHVAGEKIA